MKVLNSSVKLVASQETIRNLVVNSQDDPRFSTSSLLLLIKKYLVTP